MSKENGFYDSVNKTFNLEIQIDVRESQENIIQFEINNFSEWLVSKKDRNSERLQFGNFQWYIGINNYQDPKDNDFYLQFYLFCESNYQQKYIFE